MVSYRITENEAAQRLDKFLGKLLPNCPKGLLYKQLRQKNITLNQKKAGGQEILTVEDEIRIFMAEETLKTFGFREKSTEKDGQKEKSNKGKSLTIPVLFSSKDVWIINKPYGVLSQGDGKGGVSVLDWLLCKPGMDTPTFKASVANRLDRNTTGIMCCGTSLPGSQVLSEVIKTRQVKKYYLCLGRGRRIEEGVYTAWLLKDHGKNKVTLYDQEKEGALLIKTRIKPLTGVSPTGAICYAVELITGKSHQIRAHMAHLSCPIIGDPKYAGEKGGDGQLLHAFCLAFPEKILLTRETDSHKRVIKDLSGRVIYAPLPTVWNEALRREGVTWQPGTAEDCGVPF